MVRKLFLALVLALFLLSSVSAMGWTVSMDSPTAQNYGYKVNQFNWSLHNIDVSSISACWYSLNNGATNVTINNCADTLISDITPSNEGNNTWTIYANLSSGSEQSSSVTFFVDSIDPAITFINPATNPGYFGSGTINLQVGIVEDNPQSTEFKIYNSNNVLQYSLFSLYPPYVLTASKSGLPEGTYTCFVTVADLIRSKTVNVTAIVDSTAPRYSNPSVSPSSPTTYSFSSTHLFEITWTDTGSGVNPSTAMLNFASSSYLMSQSGNDYSITLPSLAAGTYSYNFSASDKAGNSNRTSTLSYTVNKATPTGSLSIAPSWTVEYGSPIMINYSEPNQGDADVNYNISIFNGSDYIKITPGADISKDWGIGSREVRLTADSGQNYTGSMLDNKTLVIQDTTGPTVTIVNTDPINNKAYSLGTNFTFQAHSVDLSGTASCTLTLNGNANAMSSDGDWYFLASGLAAGKYLWNVTCVDNSNNHNPTTTETRSFTILPDPANSGSFDNYTNLTAQPDISNVSYFFVGNQFGSINWTQPIDFSRGFDWTLFINISSNSVDVNSTGAPEFNKPAIITLYNLTWASPRILKNGAVCSDCSVISYINGTLIFSVSGFSTYTTDETPANNQPSGGSGGGSGGCSSDNWTCTDWSTCTDGNQARTCSKSDPSCYYTTSKPAESQACTAPIVLQSTPSEQTPTELSSNFNAINLKPKPAQGNSWITGAAIGVGKAAPILGGLVFIAIIIAAFAYTSIKRRNSIDAKLQRELASVNSKK